MKHIQAVLLGLVFVLTGCVEYRQSLTLHADGSGTFEVSYAVEADTAQALLQTGVEDETRGDSSAIRLFEEQRVREDFRSYEALGVYLEHVDSSRAGTTETMRLRFRFEELQGILQTPFFAQSTVSLRREGSEDLALTQTLSGGSFALDPAIDLSDPQADAALREQWRTFRAEISFTVPGTIRTTNADRRQGRTAVWIFDPAVDSGALGRIEQAQFKVVFDASGAALSEIGPNQIRLALPGADP